MTDDGVQTTDLVDADSIRTMEDLSRTLDETRRSAGITLDGLSRRCSIPRSTLHTYLTGRSLPAADQFDRITSALGVPEDRLRPWADARDRVEKVWHATGSRSPASATSRLAAEMADWRSGLDEALQENRRRSQVLMHSEHVHIGADRMVRRVEITQSVIAKADDAQIIVRIIPPRPGLRGMDVRFELGAGCRAVAPVPLKRNGAAIFPIEFDRVLSAGQTHHIEYALDYEGVWDYEQVYADRVTETGCLMDSVGPPMEFRTQFDEAVTPKNVRQIYLAHPDSAEERVRDIELDDNMCAHMFVTRPVAGCHGIKWEWD